MTEFQIWLNKNQDKFTTYTADEIAQVAIACGFTYQEVAQYVTRQKFEKGVK